MVKDLTVAARQMVEIATPRNASLILMDEPRHLKRDVVDLMHRFAEGVGGPTATA
jgi:ABC-type sugar transport system ATPase subunit